MNPNRSDPATANRTHPAELNSGPARNSDSHSQWPGRLAATRETDGLALCEDLTRTIPSLSHGPAVVKRLPLVMESFTDVAEVREMRGLEEALFRMGHAGLARQMRSLVTRLTGREWVEEGARREVALDLAEAARFRLDSDGFVEAVPGRVTIRLKGLAVSECAWRDSRPDLGREFRVRATLAAVRVGARSTAGEADYDLEVCDERRTASPQELRAAGWED